MERYDKISTGLKGFDQAIDHQEYYRTNYRKNFIVLTIIRLKFIIYIKC